MGDFKIFKFTGYMITPNDVEKEDVLNAIDCIGDRLDGIIKNPRIDEREIPDWEIGNDNHPLNYSDAPIELCEQYFKTEDISEATAVESPIQANQFDINEYDDPDYFEQQKIAELEENEIRAEY